MLEVLIFMFQNYLSVNDMTNQANLDDSEITQELAEAGFDHNDIVGAFNWYKQLRSLMTNPYHEYLSAPKSIRVYTADELTRIDAESMSFLDFLGKANVIEPAERDLIIDRAMALETGAISIEEVRWITMIVLWDDTRKKDYLFVEDAIFNPKSHTIH